MADQDDGDDNWVEKNGPNSLCFTCAGLRKISEARLYVVQATEDLQTGMTMAEWRTCPQCGGKGYLPGLQPPV
ncbi:hypothetical protein [Saccharopolyspora phatthalungensis]|uniref:DnaJ-class molecular chaperone n=1 Tax=Saccharopolyspora phatthalungensis TaxID=664693 RepID=A0A840Q1E0_9PSEU|nr:hypothetical protein [Saccharopolyspora phatthalungensis]MBB5156332.1 DnaJ-class molecular chaperone [Saccharopolyspora phatthalungensis]